eukprot:6211719-Pleurochrysis_carterae.AAC.1
MLSAGPAVRMIEPAVHLQGMSAPAAYPVAVAAAAAAGAKGAGAVAAAARPPWRGWEIGARPGGVIDITRFDDLNLARSNLMDAVELARPPAADARLV